MYRSTQIGTVQRIPLIILIIFSGLVIVCFYIIITPASNEALTQAKQSCPNILKYINLNYTITIKDLGSAIEDCETDKKKNIIMAEQKRVLSN